MVSNENNIILIFNTLISLRISISHLAAMEQSDLELDWAMQFVHNTVDIVSSLSSLG